MPIQMRCHCGQDMITQDQHAGRTVKCPGCAMLLLVPSLHSQSEAGVLPDEINLPDDEPPALELPDAKAKAGKTTSRPGMDRSADFEFQKSAQLDRPCDDENPLLEIDPVQLDDDNLFSDNSEVIVETDVQIETGDDMQTAPPPLQPESPPPQAESPSSRLQPPPLPTSINDAPSTTMDSDEGDWADYADVDVERNEGRRQSRKKPRSRESMIFTRMSRVDRGLLFFLLMCFGWMILMSLLIFFVMIGGFSVSANHGRGATGLRIILAFLHTFGWLATAAFGVTGTILCAFAPRKIQLTTLSIIAASFFGAAFLFKIIAVICVLAATTSGGLLASVFCDVTAWTLSLAAAIIIMFILRRLARYLREECADREANYLISAWPLVHYLVPILFACGYIIMVRISQREPYVVGLIVIYVLCAVGFVTGFYYWVLHWAKVLLRLLNVIATLRYVIEYRYLTE